MAFSQRWQTILHKHMSAVPKGSPFPAFQAAVKSASAEYRGLTHRANPDTAGLVKAAVILGVGLVAYKAIKTQADANIPAEQKPISTGTGL